MLGIFFSIFTLTRCPITYAEDFQSVPLAGAQQAAEASSSQSSSHDQERMEQLRIAREAYREREAQERQEREIARQKKIGDIMQHSHDATVLPSVVAPTQPNHPIEQVDNSTISTTQNQTDQKTSTLPQFLVLLGHIGLAIFWLKNSRKKPQATTRRNQHKTKPSRQNINNKSNQINSLVEAGKSAPTIHVDPEVKHAIAYLRHYGPMPKWIDPNSDTRITLGDNEKQKQEGPVWKVVHSGFMVSFVNDEGNSLRGINIPTLTHL